MMNTLEKICLCIVARNASCYKLEDFKALNVYILEQLVSYLGAYQLNRLHDIFVKAGVEVERVWKRHLTLHWSDACDFSETVFHLDDVRGSGTEQRRDYLERLFHKVISKLDSRTDEPRYVTKLRRLPRCHHGICFQCLDSTALDSNVLQRELPQYAVHVQILSIAATSPMIQYLLNHPDLLKILQGTVRRLDMHYINACNFGMIRELVRLFVEEGSMSEFSLFNSSLPSERLEDLLRLVSGQQAKRCIGSLSTPVEHRVVGVERKRSLEDEACTSMEMKEQGRKRFGECDEVDIPTTMTIVDERKKNLTRTDETNQASEDSVASSSDLADDGDLYAVALTTCGSNANSSRSGRSCPIRGDPLSLRAVDGLSGATIKPAGCNTSASHLGNSQSGCEHHDSVVFNSETSSTVGSDSLSPCSASPPRSCTSFTLAYFFGLDAHNVLFRVLRNWTTLQRLALLEVSDSRSDFPCAYGCCSSREADVDTSAEDHKLHRKERDDFQNFLYRLTESNQLTHIVSCDAVIAVNVVDAFALAFLTKRNDRRPMEEIKIRLNPEQDFSSFQTFVDSTEEFFGTRCLNFFEVYVGDETTSEFVMSWIRRDRALRCLHFPRFDDFGSLTQTLQILECNQRIEELHLNGSEFNASSVSSLVSVLQSCPSLRKLSLDECELSKEDIDWKSFVKAISTHPTLTELSLRDNYLEDIGCDLLKAICLRNRFFNSLDLSFNRIEGKLLFKTCQEIQTELRKQHRSRFPLSMLDLSENLFHLEWRNRLVQTLVDWVDVFVAQELKFQT